MTGDHQTYSRYQVLCAEREAWIDGEVAGTDTFYYDGMSFWRRDGKGKERLVPSWRTPAHGWRHAPSCQCDLCGADEPGDTKVVRPFAVA